MTIKSQDDDMGGIRGMVLAMLLSLPFWGIIGFTGWKVWQLWHR